MNIHHWRAHLERDSLKHGLVIVTILLVQFLLVSFSFPVSELFTEKPLFHIDTAVHWYHLKMAANMAPHMIGYDPYFAAGYPGGITLNGSANVPMVLAMLLSPWMTEIVLYKCYIFACASLGPAFVPLAACLFRLDFRHIALSGLFALILWWASYFHWYHTAGMVSFVVASFMSLPYFAGVYRYLEGKGDWATLITLGVVGAFGLFCHPFFPISVMFATTVYIVLTWRVIDRRRLIKLMATVPALALIPNLSWLYPVHYYSRAFSFDAAGVHLYQKVVDINLVWQELIGRFKGNAHGAKIYGPLFLGAVFACVIARDKTKRRIALVLTIAGLLLILYAGTGAAIEAISNLQPNRIAPVGYLFLLVPAVMGVYEAIRISMAERGALLQMGVRTGLAGVVLVCLYSLFEVGREIGYGDWGRYGSGSPQVRGIGEYSKWMLGFLKRQTTPKGRVLFEISAGRIYDDAHMAGYYAYTGDREFIGGHYPYVHFASFWDGELFGRPIDHLSKEKFQEYMDLYNVGWIVVHSDASKRYLDTVPGITVLEEYKEFKTYRISRSLDFFARGKGIIYQRTHNALTVTDIEGERITLKYHFIPGMVSIPPAEIIPTMLMDDPNPFITVVLPPKTLRFYLP